MPCLNARDFRLLTLSGVWPFERETQLASVETKPATAAEPETAVVFELHSKEVLR